MRFLLIKILALFVVSTSFGQIKCTKIPKNYCGECAYYYKRKRIQKIVAVENGIEVDKSTAYSESGRIVAVKDFQMQNELTGTLTSYDPLTGEVLVKMDFFKGTGTFEYSLNGCFYSAYFVDGKPNKNWTKSNGGLVIRSVQSHLFKAPSFESLSQIYTFSLLSFINFLDSDNFSYDPYEGDHELINKVNESYFLSLKGNSEIQNAGVESLQSNDSIVDLADKKATFAGGQETMRIWILNNFYYPPEAVEGNITGKVYLSFVVEIDGSISNVRVQKGVHELLDKEAIRLLYTMPKWLPAEKNGQYVRTLCRLPIGFNLN